MALKIRGSDWLTFPLIIVNFNHFFIQPAPEMQIAIMRTSAQKFTLKYVYPSHMATRRHSSTAHGHPTAHGMNVNTALLTDLN